MTDMLHLIPWWGYVAAVAAILIAGTLTGLYGGGRGGSGDDLDTARAKSHAWATPKDVQNLIVTPKAGRDPRRMRLGFLGKWELANPTLRSVMVIAPSGAGKTPRVVVPAVLGHTGPAVIASVKADVLALTRAHRTTQGPVWVFDLSQTAGETARWSPLTAVTDWASALDAAKWLQESSKTGSSGSGVTDAKFWDDNARYFLAPLVYLAAVTRQPMGILAGWVAEMSDETMQRVAEALRDTETAHPTGLTLAASGYWTRFSHTEPKTRTTIITTAFTILEGWAHPMVLDAVSVTVDDAGDDDVVDIDLLLDRGGTLYLVAPASDQEKFTHVFETLVNAIVMNVEHRAHRHNGQPLDPPLLLALDEAANIAPLRKLDQLASKSAGEGILVLSIWQDTGQIDRIYGPATARTVVSNHYARIYLPGIQDEETLERLSRQIGQDRISVTSVSYGQGSTSRTHSYQDIVVAPAAILRQLPADQAIIMVGREKPIRATIPGWFEDQTMRQSIPLDVQEQFDRAFMAARTRKKATR